MWRERGLPEAVVDFLADGVQLLGRDDRYRYVNEAAARHLGRAREDLVGRTLAEAFDGVEDTELYARLRRCRLEGAPDRFEGEPFGGGERRFALRLEPTPEGVVIVSKELEPASLRDGSDPVAAASRLRESEDRYRRVLEQTPAGIAVHTDGRIVFASPAAARMLRYGSAEELVGTAIEDIVHPDSLDAARARIARLLEGDDRGYPVQDRYVRKDGTVADVEVVAASIVYAGRPSVQVIASDITERKRAEDALIESERRYRTLFENMSVGFVLFEVVQDHTGRPVDLILREVNAGFERTTGLTAREVTGRRLTEVLPGIERDDFDWIGTYGRVALGGEPQHFETFSELLGRAYSVAAFSAGPRSCAVTFSDVTERHRAEAALRAEEERFRQVFEAANVGKSITRPTGEVFVNQCFADLLGYSRDELNGKRWWEITPEEELASNAQVIAALLEGSASTAHFTKTYVAKDGGLVWADVSVVLVRDEAGAPAYFVTTVVDISDQRRAVEALRQSEQMFASAFHGSPAGLTISRDRDGALLDVNDAFLEMFELDRDEVVGSDSVTLGLLTPETRAELRAADALQDRQLRARSKSGRRVDVLFSSRPIRVGDEDCHISTMVDVTEQRIAEEALRASEQRYQRLAENLPDVVWRTDVRGRVQYVNRAVTRFLGYSPEELMDRPLSEYLTPASTEKVVAWLREAPCCGPSPSTFLAEVEYLDREGRAVPGELHAVAVCERGEIVAVEGITRDVGERRRVEQERSQLQAQLQQAQKLESVGRLAGGVAHDFNNLLLVIQSYVGFATEALREADPIREDLEEIQKAAARATALTRQLLAFSRRQVLEPEVLDLNGVVSDIHNMLRRLLGEDIEVTLRLGASIDSVRADPGQIEQVLMNLAVNARDAMPQGGELTIATSPVQIDAARAEALGLTPGPHVSLTVTDTGTGMGEEVLEHLFEPFYTTKPMGKGTGLGLATVYGIVRQSGGSISVQTELGRGTSFDILLPAVAAAPAERPRSCIPSSSGGRETVLLVEDEDAVRRIAERVLRSAGYRVLPAAGGGDALILFEQHGAAVDVLLTDVVMPQMSGPALAERLTDQRPALRVLYMSGYTDDAVTEHGVLDPARILAKPFMASALLRKVREILDAAPA